tara:strand:+ start:409 stop:564 length:156 start_codon:yes stop_codon:yes gene_type:complete
MIYLLEIITRIDTNQKIMIVERGKYISCTNINRVPRQRHARETAFNVAIIT